MSARPPSEAVLGFRAMRPTWGSLFGFPLVGLALAMGLAGCASGADTAADQGGDDASSSGDGTAPTDASGGGDGTTPVGDAARAGDTGARSDGTAPPGDASGGGDVQGQSDAPGPDAAPDSGTTTGQDAGLDAPVDTGTTEGAEAGVDSGSTPPPDGGECTSSTQCTTPPAPTDCYPNQGTCSGGTCDYSPNAGAVVCGNTCCNPVNGTCNANCTLNCAGGYGHCTGDPSQGCETNTGTDTSDCGSCGRTCSASEVSTLQCTSGLCNSTCDPGWGNCNEPAAPNADDGCESNLTTCVGTPCCGSLCTGLHQNGLGQTYVDCSPLGVPGNAATYSSTMASEAASSWPNPGGTAQILTGGACYESNHTTQDECDASYTFFACSVWCFTGQLAGYVYENVADDFGDDGSNCLCPTTTSGATWN